MFDIAKQNPVSAAEAGYKFDVTLPDGSKTDFKITVRGDNSPTVKNHGRSVYQQIKTQEQQAKRRGKEWEIDLDEAEDMSSEAAAVRVIGWEGLAENGKEVPFTKEKAIALFKEHAWLRDQVMEASQNPFNFRL
jgi:hypothetical protein